MKRREFLIGAVATGLTIPALSKSTIAAEGGAPLPIPAVLSADNSAGNNLDAIIGEHSFLANGMTRTAGYGQNYLGPVLRMKRGQRAG